MIICKMPAEPVRELVRYGLRMTSLLTHDGGATGGASVPVACLAAGGGMNMGKYVCD